MTTDDPLHLFVPPVRAWFRGALGEPTPPQRLGWPVIAAGKNTLILSPTGSGKTLAAFLACLDWLWRQDPLPRGVQVLYVSPLKALNNDIHRNLQAPLTGVAETARRMDCDLPPIETAVRTGDTPTAERQRLVRRPPHVLITTPESLHLLLTSRARETLRTVKFCIVDEIHALCPNKRGVFLALLLERLAELTPHAFTRIGLSATQRPLEEVARYLGGQELTAEGRFVPRPVTIVDAGQRKDLDLQVISPVEHFGPLPEKTIWPSIYRLLADQVQTHRSTIVFANNRRAVERITACLNEIADDAAPSARAKEENDPVPVRAHHGSVALEVRRATEEALKEGRLRAVVATASLEMGIDMGAVDLVCQVESPGNVARGLQRVGRAGHLVGQKSKGRLVPKTLGDLLEQAVLAREMSAGRVEEIRVPINCLDVLAQQLVAMAAMDPWEIPRLYTLLRRAYPYRDLSPQALDAVLEMISGRYRFENPAVATAGLSTLNALQPRVSWDRIHNRLLPLPGSQQMALVNGGTIPDTGQYAVVAPGNLRLGEVDEEFVYERRVGDAFLLGTNAWRIEQIEADRVLVTPAEGAPAMVPFWRGENTGRSYDLGAAIGEFLRDLSDRLYDPDISEWLQREYHVDAAAARNLRLHVLRQLERCGTLPTDRTLFVEASRDPLGDWQVILLSPLGSRLHLTLRLAIEARLRQRLGYRPQCMHHDDGLLMRLTDTDEPVLDLLEGLTPKNVEALVLEELADSPLFALRFRQNAARALLLPRGQAGKRAPLWLQRLRGRDLLQVARRHPDFPIVAETFRECLHDHLDLPRLQQLLSDIRSGEVAVATKRLDIPSPFASGLLFSFNAAYQYQYDGAESEPDRTRALDRELLDQLVSPQRHGHLLDPRAVHQVERRLRGLGQPPRTATEMAEWLRRLGDVTASDLEGPMAVFLEELESDGRAVKLELPGAREPSRWVLTEEVEVYRRAFGLGPAESDERQQAASAILHRYLATHALVALHDVLARYPFEEEWARRKLEDWAASGRAVVVRTGEGAEPLQWSAPENLEQVQRGTLALLRREVVTVPAPQFADFLTRWQGVHPEGRRGTTEGLQGTLVRLEGLLLPAELWERTVLPSRVSAYQPRWLDESIASGEWLWVGQGDGDSGPGDLTFLRRSLVPDLPPPQLPEGRSLSEQAGQILEALRTRGAQFVTDLAQTTDLSPSTVRSALRELVRYGLVTNDRYDVVRRGEESDRETGRRGDGETRRLPRLGLLLPVSRSPGLPVSRRGVLRPEGRWSLVAWGWPDTETLAVHQATLLLTRYGILARELAAQDGWALPWRVLYEVLSRMELAGEVRRGYFVEGLSGAQFALPEAARLLEELSLPSSAAAPPILLHSQDPANLYGSGAPFDIALLDGGTRPLLRRGGNWLVSKAGRPVLIVEQQGKKLTALPSASREDVTAAVGCLPAVLTSDQGLAASHRLTVAEWNGQPVTTTEGRELLEALGFVRDYQSMTLYAAWR